MAPRATSGHHVGPTDGPARARWLRWLVFLATNVYLPIGVGNFPERWVDGADAQTSLKTKPAEQIGAAWRALEMAMEPSLYLLGPELGALQVFVAM